MSTADEFYKNAVALRGRIIAGQSNEHVVQAWASVARECAKASDAMRRELGDRVHGRAQQAWFGNLDKIWWAAKAQVETLARAA